MSAAQAPDPARFEDLRRRFESAAYDHPNVDAVVVCEPDLRHDESEREARDYFRKVIPPAFEYSVEPEYRAAEELAESMRHAHEAMRYVVQLDRWVPAWDRSISQLGGQEYSSYHVRGHAEHGSDPGYRTRWQCTLFGSPAGHIGNTGLRLFNLLAPDAARLILQGTGLGDKPQSGWLIHLANREEPLVPAARRWFLNWSTFCGKPQPPMWIPVTAMNPPTKWWAVRLSNVFQLSRDAVQLEIDLAARAPTQENHCKRQQRRRSFSSRARRPQKLTHRQLLAYELIARHQGDVTAAAAEAGCTRQNLAKLVKAARAKLAAAGIEKPGEQSGRSGASTTRRSRRLPQDARGQDVVPDPDAADPSDMGG
jgi:hypothetical protein